MKDNRLQEVQRYYDEVTPLYLAHLGPTLQMYLLAVDADGVAPATASNVAFAAAAGIQPGDRVLDAGCGVCGPSVDIATAIDDITIDAVTLSSVQARLSRQRVAGAGLAGRIRVTQADYHQLPFAGGAFDTILFLESALYSHNPVRLYREAYRLLRPGGRLYVKCVFRLERELSPAEEEQLARFNEAYAVLTPRLSETLGHIRAAGFHVSDWRLLPDELTNKMVWERALWTEDASGATIYSAFGEFYSQDYEGELHVYCAEIKATRETAGARFVRLSRSRGQGTAGPEGTDGPEGWAAPVIDRNRGKQR